MTNEIISGASMLFAVAVFYFVPSIIAIGMKKRNAGAIVALNLFLGWTFVGWVVALVWSMMRDEVHPALRSQRGSILIEFAVALPVMLLLVLGGLDLSLASSAKSGLNYIASETAACVARAVPSCPGGALGYAQGLAPGVGLNSSKIGASQGSCGPTCVTITVTYTTTPISPFMKALPLSSVGNATK